MGFKLGVGAKPALTVGFGVGECVAVGGIVSVAVIGVNEAVLVTVAGGSGVLQAFNIKPANSNRNAVEITRAK